MFAFSIAISISSYEPLIQPFELHVHIITRLPDYVNTIIAYNYYKMLIF